MFTRRWCAAVGLMVAAVCAGGCGGDPESSRIPPMTQAYLYDSSEGRVLVSDMFDDNFVAADPKSDFVVVGTKVLVLDDDEPDDSATRHSRVKIAEGPNSNRGGLVMRNRIRVAPR